MRVEGSSGHDKENDPLPKNWKGAFRYARPQLIILGAIGTLHFIAHLGAIPSPAGLNHFLQIAFKEYGVPLVAACSFLENLAIANGYFPGAFTILAGMASTSGDPARALIMYLAIFVPAVIANLLSYWIGRLAEGNNPDANKEGSRWRFWLTYWHPQLASITAFEIGSDHSVGFSRFAMRAALPCLAWSIFWATCIYWTGTVADVGGYFWSGFILYLVVWTALRIRSYWRKLP